MGCNVSWSVARRLIYGLGHGRACHRKSGLPDLRQYLMRKSGLPDLRQYLMRKSGKPDFRCHRRLRAAQFGKTWMPAKRGHDEIPGTNVPAVRFRRCTHSGGGSMGIFWMIVIGFVAGVIAKFLHPGSNEPSGFILTTLLGIAGAFVATYLGQALGWYTAAEGAGPIGAVVGAIIVLVVWGFFAPRSAAT